MNEENEFLEFLGINKEEMNNRARIHRKKNGKGCALCDYTGLLITHKGSEFCSCIKNKMLKDIFIKANVPKIYLGKTMEDWNTRSDNSGNDLGAQQTISERVYYLLKNYERLINKICRGGKVRVKHSNTLSSYLHSLNFEGGIGSGKTFIASVMVQAAIREKLNAKYYEWSDILQIVTDYDKKEQLDEIVDDFANMDFIALDGVENYNYSHPQMPIHIDRISRARINSGKPIFIMSNGNISNIVSGSGWPSLIRKCLTIRLPNAIN